MGQGPARSNRERDGPWRERPAVDCDAVDGPTFSVSELNELIRQTLAVTFPEDLWLEGEISSLKRSQSGHVYFQLIDGGPSDRGAAATSAPTTPNGARASIDIVLFNSARLEVNALLRRSGAIRMSDGVHIRIRGRVDFYPPQGRLQFRMTAIDPEYTLGRIAAARDRVLRLLAEEGLLDRNRSLVFPALPHHVGLVTSDGSAAHADFLGELEASGIDWRIAFVHSPMQGAGAERAIVSALQTLERRGVEVIALVRGGGARTDLMTFDSELVARAIASLSLPVVTGIGHDIDRSVADVVAARSFKTPTACAAAFVDDVRAGVREAEAVWDGIVARVDEHLDASEHELGAVGHRISTTARTRLAQGSHALDRRTDRIHALALGHTRHHDRALAERAGSLGRRAPRVLRAAEQRLAIASARTDALDPRRSLARGWSITRTGAGKVLRSSADVAVGDELITSTAAGTVHSTVTATTNPDDE